MKYTIEGFSQKMAILFRNQTQKIDCTDLVILRWFIDFKDTPKIKHIDINDKRYYWINYEKVMHDLPILSMSKRSVYSRFQKLVDFGILSHYHLKEKGSFSYYGLGKMYDVLISDDENSSNEYCGSEVNFRGGMKKTSEGVGSQLPSKDSSIIDSSTRDNTPYNPPEGDGSLYSRMDRDGVLHDEPDFEQTQLEHPVQTAEKPKRNTRKTKKAIVEQEQQEKFNKFWEAWPKKIDKQRAFALWVKENPDDELFNRIMTSLEAQKKQESWCKDGGKYIPNPRNWIEGKRWEDQTSVQVGVSSNVSQPIKELFEQSTSFDWFDE